MRRVALKKARGRRPFKPDERVIAIESGYVEAEHGPIYFKTGMEFDSGHEAVLASPTSFMPADTPSNEVIDWLPKPPEPEAP